MAPQPFIESRWAASLGYRGFRAGPPKKRTEMVSAKSTASSAKPTTTKPAAGEDSALAQLKQTLDDEQARKTGNT